MCIDSLLPRLPVFNTDSVINCTNHSQLWAPGFLFSFKYNFVFDNSTLQTLNTYTIVKKKGGNEASA